MDKHQPRVLKGLNGAGRFAKHLFGESNVTVGPAPSLPDLAGAGPDDIRALSASSDPAVLAELTASPAISDDVLEKLQAPSQPTAVRLAAVSTGYAGTADRAARDPHPLVRAAALVGWDLSEDSRTRLANDHRVRHALQAISA